DGLGDFRTFLNSEVATNLRPGSDDVIYEHVMGVRFGNRNPGYNVGQATSSYRGALVTSTNNLDEYANTARTLTQHIRPVIAGYRASDLSGAGSSSQLNGVLSDALKVMKTPDSETDREANRGRGNPDENAAEHLATRLKMSENGLPQ